MAMQNSIKRTVHFYELVFDIDPNYQLEPQYKTFTQALLSKITVLVSQKSPLRYQLLSGREIFMNEVSFPATAHKRVISGKVLSIRKDHFPMLHNTTTDEARDIETLQGEGVLETTHFVMQESDHNRSNKIKVALEYNLYGAKIGELRYYLEELGKKLKVVRKVGYVLLTTKEIKDYPKRMGHVSKILVRVHRNEIPNIQSVEGGLFQTMQNVKDHFEQEYVTLSLDYNVRKHRKDPTSHQAIAAKNFVSKIIGDFVDQPNHTDFFEQFEVTAEDSEHNQRLEAFNLLIGKVKDSFHVDVSPKNRTIISSIMFEKMREAWDRLKIKL